MSVNYSKIHNVDIPVTDLDERDDDVFGPLTDPPPYEDPLNGLDYEDSRPLGQDRSAGLLANIRLGWEMAARNVREGVQMGMNQANDSFFSVLPNTDTISNANNNNNNNFGDYGNNGYVPRYDWRESIRSVARGLVGKGPLAARFHPIELSTFGNSSDDSDIDLPPELDTRKQHKCCCNCLLWCHHVLLISFIVIGSLALCFAGGYFIILFLSTSTYFNATQTRLSNGTHEFFPTTILISLDGFHPHYINAKLTPTLHNMLIHDYGAPYMEPLFPLLTFPNHWTLVTGLYPSEHGVVGNTFYDPILKKQFINTDKMKGVDPDFWHGGEPIWATAHRQGVSLAVHMWPGLEVPGIGQGNGPMYVDSYNGLEVLLSKVDRLLTWLDVETVKERPQLLLSYVPTIDTFGHKYGISGSELEKALTYVDDFLDLLFEELKSRNLESIVNVVVVSDHGMAPTLNDRLLYLDDIVDFNRIEHVDGWPLFGLRPEENYAVDDLYADLQANLAKDSNHNNFKVYKVEDFPPEYNFGGALHDHTFNYRLAPVWVVPNVGYSITTHKQMKEFNYDYKPKGVHGYNNTELLMRAVFLGRGPYFELLLGVQNKKIQPFANTEVYKLVCESLGITPAANNGSMTILLQLNLLPLDWTDELVYPNVPFEVDHVVKDATYDLLWKKPLRSSPTTVYVSTNQHPKESLSRQSTLAEVLEHIPKPTDFTDPATVTATTTVTADPPRKTKKPHYLPSWVEDLLDEVGDILHDIGDNMAELIDEITGNDS